jgi:hypothetical protein
MKDEKPQVVGSTTANAAVPGRHPASGLGRIGDGQHVSGLGDAANLC